MRDYRDMLGRPVERTPEKYPYSYDPYVIYKEGYIAEDQSFYSDRLNDWYSYERIEELKDKYSLKGTNVFWKSADIDVLNMFISELFGINVEITGIMEGCNYENGYPFYLIFYREEGCWLNTAEKLYLSKYIERYNVRYIVRDSRGVLLYTKLPRLQEGFWHTESDEEYLIYNSEGVCNVDFKTEVEKYFDADCSKIAFSDVIEGIVNQLNTEFIMESPVQVVIQKIIDLSEEHAFGYYPARLFRLYDVLTTVNLSFSTVRNLLVELHDGKYITKVVCGENYEKLKTAYERRVSFKKKVEFDEVFNTCSNFLWVFYESRCYEYPIDLVWSRELKAWNNKHSVDKGVL